MLGWAGSGAINGVSIQSTHFYLILEMLIQRKSTHHILKPFLMKRSPWILHQIGLAASFDMCKWRYSNYSNNFCMYVLKDT